MDIKAEIVRIGVILLPIISMLIPKVLGDARTRKLLGSIELGADLKTKGYTTLLEQIEQLKDLMQSLLTSKEVFENIREVFTEMVDDFKIVDTVKEEIAFVREELVNTMEKVQELSLAAHDLINVKEVIAEQNKIIEELRNEMNKLNNRFGGK